MKNKTEIEMILFVNDKARTINVQKLLSSPSESDIRDYIGKITTGNIIVFDEDTCSTLISPLPNRICVVITSNKDFNREGFVRAESIRDFIDMLGTKFDRYRDVYVMVDNIHIARSFMGYVNKVKMVEVEGAESHNRYELSDIPHKMILDIRRSSNVVWGHHLNDLVKITDYEFKDNVLMCTANVDGFGCYGVCAREPRVHVNGFGETVRRKSDHRESIVLHKGDRVFMKTDIEIYRIPKNVYVEVKTILHYFVYNGISVESSSITDGVVCVGLVNMGSKSVTIHKDQTIAVLAIRGEHEFLKVAHKEFPCEKVDGWNNYESKEKDHRRPLKDDCCVGDMMERCCEDDGF